MVLPDGLFKPFDRIVIVDMLEHLRDEESFLAELNRIMKPEGRLIINVPHLKNSVLRRFRLAIGQTDEKHGHIRPGYTVETLGATLGKYFRLGPQRTYSKFFSEFIDTVIAGCYSLIKRGVKEEDGDNYYIREGIVIIPKESVIQDKTVI